MSLNRRKFIVGFGAVSAVSVSGCMDMIAGDGINLSAEPAGLSEDHSTATGFTIDEYQQGAIDETVSAGDFAERDIFIEYNIISYSTEGSRPAGIMFITSGSHTIAGTEINPIYGMSGSDLIRLASTQYDGFDDVEKVEEYDESNTQFGDITVEEFIANAGEVAGNQINIKLYTSQVRNDDAVVGIIGYHLEEDVEDEENIKSHFREFVQPTEMVEGRDPDQIEDDQLEEEI